MLPAFRDPSYRADLTGISSHAFKCERCIAEKITPLLQLVVEPEPEFIPWARETLEAEHYKALMRYAGVFLGDMAVDVCKPIWKSFPDPAPEGWLL